MTTADLFIEPWSTGRHELIVRFLAEWATGSERSAREHLADHPSGAGSSLVAVIGARVVGIVTIRWQSNYPGFRDRGIPLVHQLSVAEPFRRRGIATALLDAAEQLARERDVTTLGITVGLFDEYGPAQRMYASRGYLPDGRGACLGRHPVAAGTVVTMDHDLIIWLTKALGGIVEFD